MEDALLIGLGIVAAALVVYLIFIRNGGLFKTGMSSHEGPATSAQSDVTPAGSGSTTAHVALPAATVKAAPLPKGRGLPTPLQGLSVYGMAPSAQHGGSNPYTGLSALVSEKVGGVSAEQAFSAPPGSGPGFSLPGSAPITATDVNAGTTGSPVTTSGHAANPSLAMGAAGIWGRLARSPDVSLTVAGA
jgi:hypothetical protein